MTAASNREKLINEESINKLFKIFDLDGDGFIDMTELKTGFESCYVNYDSDEAVWEQILAEADQNGDGVISPTEFHDIMMDILKNKVAATPAYSETPDETPGDTPGETLA